MARRKPTPQAQDKLDALDVAVDAAIEAGASGDDLLRQMIAHPGVWDRIVTMQVRNAMSGSREAAKWLADRAFGTPSQTIKHEGNISLEGIFANPLDSTDDLYDLEAEEVPELESGD